jgi:hypothetical protein
MKSGEILRCAEPEKFYAEFNIVYNRTISIISVEAVCIVCGRAVSALTL